MAKTKWWVVALATLLVVVVLAAGGYALYRIGYSHGMQVKFAQSELPQRFLDQLDRLDREGKPGIIIPKLRMREFGRELMLLNRGLRHPGLFPWRSLLSIAVVVVLVALVVILAIALLTKRNHRQTVPSPTPAPLQGPEGSEPKG